MRAKDLRIGEIVTWNTHPNDPGTVVKISGNTIYIRFRKYGTVPYSMEEFNEGVTSFAEPL